MLRLLHSHAEALQILDETIELGKRLNEPHVQAEAMMERGSSLLAQGKVAAARQSFLDAIVLARQIDATSVLAEACESLSKMLEDAGDHKSALALYKEFHSVREAELAGSRRHAATAAQLWMDFQEASKRASQYRERAESLAADHAALARKAKALTEVSEQDPLTSLLNRRGLDAHIGALVASSDASGEPLTLAMIDLDGFKRINDSFSHAVGDAVLRRVATIIRDQCRQNDLPVRYGGDEFLLVLANADLALGARVSGPRQGNRRRVPVGTRSAGPQGHALDRDRNEAARRRSRGDHRGGRRRALRGEGRGPQPDRDEGLGKRFGEHVLERARKRHVEEVADRALEASGPSRRYAAARSDGRTPDSRAPRCDAR